jgi:hypothetical protein
MRNVMNVLLFALACILPVSVGCSKGANPAAPSPVGGGGGNPQQLTGDILVKYVRPEAVHQYMLDLLINPPGFGHSCLPDVSPRLFSAPGQWPNGFVIRDPNDPNPNSSGLTMNKTTDREFQALVKNAPAGGGLPINAYDPCMAHLQGTGTGFWINGVKLKDELYWARFDHNPGLNPSITAR